MQPVMPMDNWIVKLIFQFNREVIKVPAVPKVKALDGDEHDWMVYVLREEAQELEDTVDPVHQVDALVDSIIFAFGGLYRMGLSEMQASAVVSAVMQANFAKKAGQLARSNGIPDAVKPEGWVPPEQTIAAILGVPYASMTETIVPGETLDTSGASNPGGVTTESSGQSASD